MWETIAVEVLDVVEAIAPALKDLIANPSGRTVEEVIEAALTAAIKSPLADSSISALFAIANSASTLNLQGNAAYTAGPDANRGR